MTETNHEQPQRFDIGLDHLFNSCVKKDWEAVRTVYRNNPLACKAKLTPTEDTVFHIMVSLNYADIPDADEYLDCVWELVESLPEIEAVEMLGLKNNKGNTPLHLAAGGGSYLICGIIAFRYPELITNRNLKGETPMFSAAQHGKIEAFLCFDHIYRNSVLIEEAGYSLTRRNDGDTILHSAIAGEYFELAYQIISCYPRLVFSVNQEGLSPLHILASKPNAFPSSSNLQVLSRMIYRCMFVERLEKKTYTPLENYFYKRSRRVWSSRSSSNDRYPDNYRTCMKFFQMLFTIARSCLWQRNRYPRSLISDEENTTEMREVELKVEDSFPPIYATCIVFFKVVIAMLFKLVKVLSLQAGWRAKAIWEMKERHEWAIQVMNELIYSTSLYEYKHDGKRPSKMVETSRENIIEPLSSPPKDEKKEDVNPPVSQGNGAFYKGKSVEMPTLMGIDELVKKMEKIIKTFPVAIQDMDADGNGVKIIRNKHESVYEGKGVETPTPILVAAKMGINEMVEKIIETLPVAIQDMDADGKNALLLTAEYRQTKVFDCLMKMNLPDFFLHQVDNEGNSALHLAAIFEQHQTELIPGVALLMQWEIKWYEHVKDSIPPQYYIPYNNKGETAYEIFTRTHEKLVKDENEWLTKTSESCSVVAALIASVAYATSSTVPGGFDQTAGYPLLENQHAFHIYSVTSVLALCFSVTALVFFLAILTSRPRQQDFRNDLPRKLLFGLISLLTSITAMLISFCAGHFFILKHQLPKQALSTYVMVCLPLSWFAMGKLPFYFDLMWSMITRVPLHSYKVHYN